MISQNSINNLVNHLGEPIITGTGKELRFCCPYCNSIKGTYDTKHHLYLNIEKKLFICHRCTTSGKARQLLQRFGIEDEVTLSSWDEVINKLRKLGEVERKTPHVIEVLRYPTPVCKATKDVDACDYLKYRKLSKELADFYDISVGEGKFSTRLFIPTKDDEGDLVFWVARSLIEEEPKYLNPPGAQRKYFLFNLNVAKQYRDVIITEGVFSSIAAGKNAVATFGKFVTSEQIDQLLDRKFETYYIALDGDATKQAIRLADIMYRRTNALIKIVQLPYGEDPASLPSSEFKKLLNEARVYDKVGSVRCKFEVLNNETC